MQGPPVRHEEVACGFSGGLGAGCLWSKLYLPDDESHGVPESGLAEGKGRFQDNYNPTRRIPTSHRGLGLHEAGREWLNQRESRFSHLLWLFSSSDLAQKARISKSTPQALGRGGKATSYPRLPSPLPTHPFLPLCFIPLRCGLLPHHGNRDALAPLSRSSLAPGRGWLRAVHGGAPIPRHMFQVQ